MNETFATTADAVAAFDAQGVLKPGEQGWWKVWGAGTRDIVAGDLVLAKCGGKTEAEWCLVSETFTPNTDWNKGCVVDGRRLVFGALQPIILVRQGTHNTLA